MRWQIEDVRAVTTVASLARGPATKQCHFCERPFSATRWISLSVARDGVGGTVVDLCESCAAASWESIVARLAQVAEMLTTVEELRSQAGAP